MMIVIADDDDDVMWLFVGGYVGTMVGQ